MLFQVVGRPQAGEPRAHDRHVTVGRRLQRAPRRQRSGQTVQPQAARAVSGFEGLGWHGGSSTFGQMKIEFDIGQRDGDHSYADQDEQQ